MKQYDTPQAFYKTPIDQATARFFGCQNFIKGTASNGLFDCAIGKLEIPKQVKEGPGTLTFRPENIKITKEKTKDNSFGAKVSNIIYLGTQTRLKITLAEMEFDAILNPNEAAGLAIGDDVFIHLPSEVLWKI